MATDPRKKPIPLDGIPAPLPLITPGMSPASATVVPAPGPTGPPIAGMMNGTPTGPNPGLTSVPGVPMAPRVPMTPPAPLAVPVAPVTAPIAAPLPAPLVGAQPPAGNPAQFLQQPGAGRGLVPAAAAAAVPAVAAGVPPPVAAAPAAPLDAQAASDRAAIAAGAGSVASGLAKTGAAALDVATLVPRAVTGAWDSTVVRGARAAGVDLPFSSPLLLPKGGDPSSMTPWYDAANRPAGMPPPAQVASAAAAPAIGAASIPAPDPVAGVPPPATPGVPTAPGADGGALPGAPASSQPPTALGRTEIPGGAADANRQAAAIAASNPNPDPRGATVNIIDGSDQRQKFFDEANLRNAAAKGSWSPRKGFVSDDAAIAAATVPIANRAKAAETAARVASDQQISTRREAGETARATLRDTGDTARVGMREAGDDRRATNSQALQQQAIDLQRDDFGLRRTAAGYDNATKARIETVQKEISAATTPEARRDATEKLVALTGRAQQARFKAVETGGGQVLENGFPVTQPKGITVIDESTGAIVSGGAAPGIPQAAASRPVGTLSTVAGKQARWDGTKWIPL